MKTFEEIKECVEKINEMEEIFRSIIIIGSHSAHLQRYTELKNRVFEILVKDIQRSV